MTTVAVLTSALDEHWLYQGIETGIALCTCGRWSLDTHVGRAPLPTDKGKFRPFSEHVAVEIIAVLRGGDPVECAICGDYSAGGVEVHSVCLDMLSRTATVTA